MNTKKDSVCMCLSSCFTLHFECLSISFHFMKNISSLFYFQKNRPFFQKTSIFQKYFEKNTVKWEKLCFFEHSSSLFVFQFLKSLLTKKQKDIFSSRESRSIDQKEQKKTLLLFQKIFKRKEFCFFLVLEFLRFSGTYFEKFQFFCEQFLFNFFEYSLKNSLHFFKRKNSVFLPSLEFFNIFCFTKRKQNSTSIHTFLFSLMSFFFFFRFEKMKGKEKKKNFFHANESLVSVKSFSFTSRLFFFKKMCFLFRTSFHHAQNCFSNMYFFSKKTFFQDPVHFFPYFQCFDHIFPFLSKGFMYFSQRNFQSLSLFSYFQHTRKELKMREYIYRPEHFRKKVLKDSQAFFPFSKKGLFTLEHFFSNCQRLPCVFFEKNLIEKKDLFLKFHLDSFSTFKVLSLNEVKQKHIVSFFFHKNEFSSFDLSFFLFPWTLFRANFQKSFFCFLENWYETSNFFSKKMKDFGKSFGQKIQVIQRTWNEFFLSCDFQKSFFHVFLCSENHLFQKIQILFYGNFLKKVCSCVFFLFSKNFRLVHLFSNKYFLRIFQKKQRFPIQKILVAFQVFQERHFFVFAKNKNLLSSFCSRFFEQCDVSKSHLFGFSNFQNFFNIFENFLHVFSTIHRFFDKKSSFHFFENKKIESFFSPFFFRNSLFSFFNLFVQESFLFQKHSLFFPKKSFLKILKTDKQFYSVFSLKTILFMIFHSFDHRCVHKNSKTFLFFPLQKTLFPFLFEKSLVFLFFQFQPSFQNLFVFGKIPSRDSLHEHLEECQNLISRSRTNTQVVLMTKLQRKITDWSKQHKNSFSKEIFEYCDFVLLKILWNWARKMHPNKRKTWLQKKYFYCVQFHSKKKWFFGKKIRNFFLCLPLH